MMYLLYGSDTKRSLEKANEIIEEYRKKAGTNLGVYRFDAEEDDMRSIKNTLETTTLFSPKKLVVIKYVSLCPDKEMLKAVLVRAKDVRETTVLLWDRELDKKTAEDLKQYCFRTQEFQKEEVLLPQKNIFKLGDTFFSSKNQAIRHLLALLSDGEDEGRVFSYLANHARTLSAIKSYEEQKKSVPVALNIHPYVAKKASAIVRPLSSEYLYSFSARFLEEDRRIKLGITKPRDSLFSILLN